MGLLRKVGLSPFFIGSHLTTIGIHFVNATLVYFLLRGLLADFGSWYLIVLGLIAVVLMLKAPKGIWGLIAERFDLHFFPVQRRVRLDAPVKAGSHEEDAA